MLNIITPDPADAIEVGLEYMTGRTRVLEISDQLGTQELRVIAVYFDAGARSRPHIHNRFDQLLYYTSGTGVIAVDGGDDQLVPTGGLVCLPAGQIHMHGASDDGPATHISILRDVDLDFDVEAPPQWKQYAYSG
jgi:quercetin dioxygenase-like cupin family protein